MDLTSKERNIILHLAYDGSAYHGWQMQKRDRTVQETLEQALSQICGHPVKCVGCGRTDAGVHARHYCANFRTAATIPASRIPFAVNARLPHDISVFSAMDGDPGFNAIGSCIRKEYIYRIWNAPIRDPFLEHRVCFYPQQLDLALMERAAAALCGRHDFSAFSTGRKTGKTP